MIMEDNKEKNIEDLLEDAKGYVDTRVEYLHLKAVEKGTRLASSAISTTLLAFFGILTLLMGTLTLAYYLSSVFESYTAGFGCVAAIYLLLSIIILFTKDKIIDKMLVNIFIKKHFDKKTDEGDGE